MIHIMHLGAAKVIDKRMARIADQEPQKSVAMPDPLCYIYGPMLKRSDSRNGNKTTN